jgi:hypothetical protein
MIKNFSEWLNEEDGGTWLDEADGDVILHGYSVSIKPFADRAQVWKIWKDANGEIKTTFNLLHTWFLDSEYRQNTEGDKLLTIEKNKLYKAFSASNSPESFRKEMGKQGFSSDLDVVPRIKDIQIVQKFKELPKEKGKAVVDGYSVSIKPFADRAQVWKIWKDANGEIKTTFNSLHTWFLDSEYRPNTTDNKLLDFEKEKLYKAFSASNSPESFRKEMEKQGFSSGPDVVTRIVKL